ncbi:MULTISPECIES: hypothetical protein [Paracoccus]|uniref:hypothetical protein n=1 Tax=Paracoccus TaxID=265 RepID=UPI001FB5C90C|nr:MULTISPECIES: hypothetical protein [Paracoccus]MCJ1902884.1 hypothetical protein [Paracoccus versutus]MDF3907401.1 hypothetical protein [Paracoccus sp. AS002]
MLRLHCSLEKLSMGLVAGIIVAASTGGLVEIAPLFTIQHTVEIPEDLRRRRRWNWAQDPHARGLPLPATAR